MRCFFASDLHGKIPNYHKLFEKIRNELPEAVFLGGYLLPNLFFASRNNDTGWGKSILNEISRGFSSLKEDLSERYPRVFIILGNDDPLIAEEDILEAQKSGIWQYVHNRIVRWGSISVMGYSFVPPTPFLLKDWERYDISRYVDPGCVSPEEGWRSIDLPGSDHRFTTIQEDLEKLAGGIDLSSTICLIHSPPYQTNLDRADLANQRRDGVPADVNVGSIAIRKFIEQHQPWITLHGHIHEAARLSGSWKDRIGKTLLFGAAHDGPELALVSFDLNDPENAKRELI